MALFTIIHGRSRKIMDDIEIPREYELSEGIATKGDEIK
jgi:hypothetical protein